MAGQNANNIDQFDAYFRKADLDGDGQISGAEAVAFFQGSNLPKQVLAQVFIFQFFLLSAVSVFALRLLFSCYASNFKLDAVFERIRVLIC